MRKFFIFISFLMINNSVVAMRCTLQKSKVFIKRHYYEQKSSGFQFDPNQVLTITGVDLEKTGKPLFCNHKHVIAYPKECENELYSDIKVAVLEEDGIDFDWAEKNVKIGFTEESKKRLKGKRYDLSESDHAIQVCSVIADMAPDVQLDFFGRRIAISNSPFHVKEVDEDILSAIAYNPDFINLSQVLNGGKHPLDHPLEGEPISPEIIDAFVEAKKKGIGIILAASNENMDIFRLYPNLPELLEKMAGHLLICYGTAYNWMKGTSHQQLTLTETKAPFSNYVYNPQYLKHGVSAPAQSILCSLYPSEPISGTSFATPIATAAAVILKSKFPMLSAVEIFDILKESSRKYPLFDDSREFPYIPGVLNITSALQFAKEKISKDNRS